MKVSVLLITYNHEHYVAEAVRSVLCQETKFDFELVVGEDCSSDATRSILAGLSEQHPDRLRVGFNSRNMGVVENFSQTWGRCRGEYVALLEGDDFWTDPHKLQRQVDFLDSMPDCSICFHAVEIVNQKSGRAVVFRNPPDQTPLTTIRELLKGNYIHTCSVMYRRFGLRALPEWFRGLEIVDWPLHLLHAEHGKIGYIPKVMAAYRVHGGGIFSAVGQVRQAEAALEVYDRLAKYWGDKYADEIALGRFGFHYALAIARARLGEADLAWSHARECWELAPFYRKSAQKTKLAARLCFPGLFRHMEALVCSIRTLSRKRPSG